MTIDVVRTGSKLTINVTTGIGYYCTFTHECGTDANAEAWRVHIVNHQRAEETVALNRRVEVQTKMRALENEAFRLKRRVQYHRRQYRKLLGRKL